MNIGFISTRLAGVDGVSLETAKLVQVFEEWGHSCFYCAGELDTDARPGWQVPSMHFYDPIAKSLHDKVFRDARPEPKVYRRIYTVADSIRQEIENFIEEFDIDLIVPQNASTIPMNISLGVAIAETIKRTQIKTICHHHDFYWERDRFINNGIQDILDEAFPPNLKTVEHVVISSVMQRRLEAWRGIQAAYLPNVFDFHTPPPPPDDYANTFREELGIGPDDLIALQPTRIVRRKAIEKAIELIRKLDDDRIILIITGYEGDEPGGYGGWLREEADRSGIRYKFIGEYVGAQRGTVNGHKVYTLWDIYPHAHFITYPSIYEGFGNALIETLYFRKPLVVHRYPAYLADIQPCGVQAVEFWHDISDDVIADTRKIIDDSTLRDRMAANNYDVGLKHFSFDKLRDTLIEVMSKVVFDV